MGLSSDFYLGSYKELPRQHCSLITLTVFILRPTECCDILQASILEVSRDVETNVNSVNIQQYEQCRLYI
jgi:hypothetical protein